MADVLAEALVELEPDIRAFSKKLNSDVKRLNDSIGKSVADAEKEFSKLGDIGGKQIARIADASEISQRNVLKGWRETARGFEQVYEDTATGVERSFDVTFKSIIKQQEAQTRSAEVEMQKLARLAERESREILRREEAQGRQITQIVQRFNRERERESAKLAAAQERQAQQVVRATQRASLAAEQEAAKLTAHYERESRKSALAIERNIGGALRSVGRSAGRGVLDFTVDTAGLSTAIGQVTKLGGLLSGLGVGALAGQAGIGGIAAVVTSLSQTIGVIALLPAAGAAAATTLGVLALGIRGVGDALSETDPAKFAEALEKLAPSARDFAQSIRDAQPAVDALQQSIQQELFANLGDEVDRLADVLIPRFQRGLVDLASEFNDVGFEFSKFITSTRTLRDVDRLIERTGKSTDILTSAVQPLLRALRDVGAVGAEFLPQLAADFTSAGIQFSEFIRHARDSGALQEFIQNGIDSTKLLASSFGNLGRVVGGVFRASNTAGSNFLETLESLTRRLANVVRSTEGQETLVSFFESAREVGEDLLPLLGSIARVIGREIAPLLADVGSNVLPAFTTTISDLGRAIGIAAPGITEFSAGFADFLSAISEEGALTRVGKLVDVLGEEFGQALRDIGPLLGEIIFRLSNELAEILPDLIPALSDFAQAFGELLKPAIEVLSVIGSIASEVVLPALTKLAETLTPIVDKIVTKVENVLIPMLPKIREAAEDLIEELGPVIDELGDAFVEALEFLIKTMPDAIGVIKDLVSAIQPLISILGPVVGMVNDVNDAFNNLVDSVPGMRDAIGPNGLFGIITAGMNPITLFQGLGRSVTGLANVVTTEMGEARRGFITDALAMTEGGSLSFEELRERVTGALGTMRTTVVEGGMIIADVLLGEFGRMKDGSLNILGEIFSGLSDFFTRTDQTITDQMFGINDKMDAAWNRMNESSSRAFGEMERRVSTGIINANNTVSTFPGLLQSSLGNIGSLLYGSGEALVAGLVAGIKAKEYAVKAAAAALMRAAAAVLPSSPAKEGPFSGRGWTPFRGAALVDGFAQGMMSSEPQLVNAADRVMRTLSEQLPAPSKFGTDALGALSTGARTAQRITQLTSPELSPNRTGTGAGVTPGDQASSDLPPFVVNVRIGERELTPMIVEVIDETNGKVRRSVTSRARRTLR